MVPPTSVAPPMIAAARRWCCLLTLCGVRCEVIRSQAIAGFLAGRTALLRVRGPDAERADDMAAVRDDVTIDSAAVTALLLDTTLLIDAERSADLPETAVRSHR